MARLQQKRNINCVNYSILNKQWWHFSHCSKNEQGPSAMLVWQSPGYRRRQELQQRKQRPNETWNANWGGINVFNCTVKIWNGKTSTGQKKVLKRRAPHKLCGMSNHLHIPPNSTLLYFFSIGIPTASLNQSTTLCRDWYTTSCTEGGKKCSKS